MAGFSKIVQGHHAVHGRFSKFLSNAKSVHLRCPVPFCLPGDTICPCIVDGWRNPSLLFGGFYHFWPKNLLHVGPQNGKKNIKTKSAPHIRGLTVHPSSHMPVILSCLFSYILCKDILQPPIHFKSQLHDIACLSIHRLRRFISLLKHSNFFYNSLSFCVWYAAIDIRYYSYFR